MKSVRNLLIIKDDITKEEIELPFWNLDEVRRNDDRKFETVKSNLFVLFRGLRIETYTSPFND